MGLFDSAMLVIDVTSDVSAIAIEGIEVKSDVCPDATSLYT